jgi:hypothetical protein
MKQTAVEWLYKEFTKTNYLTENEFFMKFNQAKEMEKGQIIEAYTDGQNNPYEYSEDNEVNWYNGERYYNETFKSE